MQTQQSSESSYSLSESSESEIRLLVVLVPLVEGFGLYVLAVFLAIFVDFGELVVFFLLFTGRSCFSCS